MQGDRVDIVAFDYRLSEAVPDLEVGDEIPGRAFHARPTRILDKVLEIGGFDYCRLRCAGRIGSNKLGGAAGRKKDCTQICTCFPQPRGQCSGFSIRVQRQIGPQLSGAVVSDAGELPQARQCVIALQEAPIVNIGKHSRLRQQQG